MKYIPDIYVKREGLADMLWRAGAACYGIPGNTAGRVHRALSVQGEIRPPMEISMGHGIFHGPWKFPWAMEISMGPGNFQDLEFSMGHGNFQWHIYLVALKYLQFMNGVKTFTFKERLKIEHFQIQLKFVALRKLSLSIERLKIEHF